MHKTKLNNTGLEVSAVCLGAGQYGSGVDEEHAREQLSHYLSLGGNFVDTAQIYGCWAGKDSPSERIIGKWMEDNRCRDNVVVSTKGAHPHLDTMDKPRVTPSDIEYDLSHSLDCLRTDYIDLYFLHRDDKDVPVEGIIDCLEGARRDGRIRYYGCSNWSVERIAEANAYAASISGQGFSCSQIFFSLTQVNPGILERTGLTGMDKATLEFHNRTGLSVMAYSAVAGGYHPKRLNGRDIPSHLREMYDSAVNDDLLRAVRQLCADGRHSVMDVMYQYLMRQSFACVPITTFTSLEQMDEAAQCSDHFISEEELDMIRKIISTH
ncbi:MAG: aldo/keto reductase [Eubacteriales bacterium]